MTTANVAELKTHFSNYLKIVMAGEPVEVCKRNVAVARMVPVSSKSVNKTRLSKHCKRTVGHGPSRENRNAEKR